MIVDFYRLVGLF